jgi:hypothetical protein
LAGFTSVGAAVPLSALGFTPQGSKQDRRDGPVDTVVGPLGFERRPEGAQERRRNLRRPRSFADEDVSHAG